MKNRKLKNLKTYELTADEQNVQTEIKKFIASVASVAKSSEKSVITSSSFLEYMFSKKFKICRTCNEILPESLFSNRKNSAGEVVKRNICKKCVQNYYQHQYKPNKASDDVKLIISGGEITPANTGSKHLNMLLSDIDASGRLPIPSDKTIFISTPKGNNEFYDNFLKQKTSKPDELFTPQNEILFELSSAIEIIDSVKEKLTDLELKIEKLFESGVK